MAAFSIPDSDRQLAERIIAPAAPREKHGQIVHEGYRFFAFGETGSGKTSFQRLVLYYTLMKGWANAAFIHDTKGIFPEYPRSIQVRNVAEWQQRGFRDGDLPVVSFRGDARSDVTCPVEEVAAYCKGLSQRGVTDPMGRFAPYSLIFGIEEMAAAMKPGRKHVDSPSTIWSLEQGRKLGQSVIGTTQSPRKVAMDILGQCSSAIYGRLTGHDANFLADVMEMDPALVRTLRGKGNAGLPNYQFCLQVKGEPWDGIVYTLDKRTVAAFE